LVKQLLEFDINDRSKYDAVMGWMYCLLAEEMIVVEESIEYDVGEMFEEFEYSGARPVLVEREEEYEQNGGDWDFF
jgi:hypothetical protein